MSDATSSLTIRVGTVGIPAAMLQIRGFASSIVREFGAPLAAIASVGGVALLMKRSIDLADTLGKTKQVVGSTVREMSGLSYAADRNNVDIYSLRVGLKNLSEWLAKNGQGSKNLKDALIEQAAVFQSMPDGIAKTNRALDLFGKAGLQMIPFLNEGPKGLEKLFERGERLNGINEDMAKSANEFNDALGDLNVSARGLAGAVAFSLLPQVTSLLNLTTEGIVRFREWSKESKSFDIALKSIGVTLGVLSAYKLGSLGVNLLAGFVGAGAVTNLRDFVALLQLTPAAATGAALALGKFTVAIGAVTAAVVLAQGWWDYWKAQVQKTDAELMATQANEKLTQTLYDRIDAMRAAGKISEAEHLALKRRVIEANKLTDQLAQAQVLREIVADKFPAGPALQDKILWSAEELEFQKKLLDVEIARADLMKERNRLAFENTHTSAVLRPNLGDDSGGEFGVRSVRKYDILRENLKLLTAQEDLLMTQRADALEALGQGVIEKSKYDETDLETQKKILTIEKERADIKKTLDNRTFGGAFNESKGADLEKWSDVKGNAGRDSWNTIKLGVDGVSDSITGAITHLKNWKDVSLEVGRAVLGQFVKTAVEGTAAFVLGENLKTFALRAGYAKRAVIWVAETVFQAGQVAKQVAVFLASQLAMSAVALAQGAIRIAIILKEGIAWVIQMAAKAAGSVANIPYVGWALAIAAFAGVMAAGMSAIDGAREQGGPPTAGEHCLGELFADAFCALWRCITPGGLGVFAFRQITPAIVATAERPPTPPDGYWIRDVDEHYTEYYWDEGGTAWVAVS